MVELQILLYCFYKVVKNNNVAIWFVLISTTYLVLIVIQTTLKQFLATPWFAKCLDSNRILI